MENKVKAMQATDNSVNWSLTDSKELIRKWSLVGYKKGQIYQLANAECYMGKSASSSKVYGFARVFYGQGVLVGQGSAGGGGYCKKSAAIGQAFDHAGIQFEKDINGRGEEAVRGALEAIAKKLGYKVFLVIT